VLAWAQRQGARRMELEVRISNRAAIALYERAGFVQDGRRRGYYRDPEEDAVLMGLPLIS
jgi:ribosomal-protein-alanine N-acetyltransferase